MTETSRAADTSASAPPLPAPEAGGILSGPYRMLTLGIVSVVLLIAFEATAVGTAMPVAARKLDGLELYAFAFSGFFTTSLLAMVVSGEWCDRRGPVAPLFSGIAVFGGGLLIGGTATAMWPFVLGRAVQGFGGGLVIVAMYVVVGRAFPERLRPSIFAAFSAGWVLPSIIGPVIAGAITEQLGWRWVFLSIPALILLPVAVMLPALNRLKRSRAEEQPPDERKAEAGSDADADAEADAAPSRIKTRRILLAAAVAVGAALLQLAGQHLEPLGLIPLAVGLLLLVPSIVRLLPRGTFRLARGLPSVILMRGLAAGTYISAESFIPLMLVEQRQISPTLAGLSLAGAGLTWAGGAKLQSLPRLARHRPRLNQLGLLIVSLALAAATLGLLHAVPAWIVALSMTFGGLGMGLVITTLSVQLLEYSAPEEAGSNSSSLQVSDALGNVLMVGLAGALFAALHGGGPTTAPGHSAVADAASAAPGSPTAYLAVLLTMSGIALVSAALAGRTAAGQAAVTR